MISDTLHNKYFKMSRRILPIEKVHADVQGKLGGGFSEVLDEVTSAIEAYPVVVVGMKQNPFVKKARKLLQEQGTEFHYLEYGSYLSEWHKRLAIKMWSGFNTYPQIFVNGILVGGYTDLNKLIENGQLAELLTQSK